MGFNVDVCFQNGLKWQVLSALPYNSVTVSEPVEPLKVYEVWRPAFEEDP